MSDPILLDLILTLVGCTALFGLLGLGAILLPWREDDLLEVERALGGFAQPLRSHAPQRFSPVPDA